MKTNLDFLKTNSDKETNGFWYDIGPASFLLRRLGGKNANHLQQVTAKYYKPYAKAIQSGMLPQSKQEEIIVKTFVEAVIVDWKGVTDINGIEIPFSKDAAQEMLMDNLELVTALQEASTDIINYRDDLGNF